MSSQYVDFGDIWQTEQLRANVLDVIAKLSLRKSVRGEAVYDSERVAKLVIEERSQHPRRQRVPDIGNALAHVIPSVGDLGGRSASLEIDEYCGRATGGKAAEEVEMRGLLQRALEPLSDLIERVLGRRARPNRLNHHRLDDETRIFVSAEPEVGQDSRRHSDDHEIGDE